MSHRARSISVHCVNKKGIVCPHCGDTRHHWDRYNKRWLCASCRHVTTLRSGTLFQSSKLPLMYWFITIHLLANKMNENRTFLGNDWSFPPALNKDGTPTWISAYEENICQGLWTLQSTSPGKPVHHYEYGCPEWLYLFEIMDISTQTLLRDEIERAVVMFEPHVELNRVDFDVDEATATKAVKALSAKTDIRSGCLFGRLLSEEI